MGQSMPSTEAANAPISQIIPAVNPHLSAGRDVEDVAPLSGPSQRTAAEGLVNALLQAGVDTFFGVPGGPIMPLFDAILGNPAVRLVESRHETHAAFEAAGYYRASGKVPVVVVTAGPGATHVATGVASAHLERVPMLVICGDVAWSHTGGRLLQTMGREGVPIEEMLQHITRAQIRAKLSRAAATQAIAALQAASNPQNPGPALLVLPIDTGARRCGAPRVERAELTCSSTVDDSLVLEVASRLAAAERPLLLLGGGCLPHTEVVKHLVELLGIPFATTPRAKGVVSERHRYSLRNFGMAASWWARDYTADGVDVALVLGTDLDDVSLGPTPPIRAGGALIHVDLDPAVFNRNYPTDTGIVCELGSFVKRLCRIADQHKVVNPRTAALMEEATSRSPYDIEDFRIDDAPHIAPHRAVADLERAAGPNATFVSDIGEHMLFALHYLTARGPGSFVIHLGLGSMGSGICSAVGLALADPSRRIVCICGDGGMQMSGSELLTAAKLRLPIVYAVFNDARYNMVHHGYKQQFARDEPFDMPWMDFVGWARSFGLPGARIERPGQITAELLAELTASGLPSVLDIRHDADVRIRGAGRVETLQQMSMGVEPV
jgi:acetolactate synthase I/II/III large subunit